MSEDSNAQHRTVGLALMGFSTVGVCLGLTMMALGLGEDAFLDGPSALGIGLVTLLVGAALFRSGTRGS